MPASKKGVLIRLSIAASLTLLLMSVAAASFVAGYSLAFWRVADLYAQTSVLKAKAAELDSEILHLKNYAVLIDAIAIQGKAATDLQSFPQPGSNENPSLNAKAGKAPSTDGALPE